MLSWDGGGPSGGYATPCWTLASQTTSVVYFAQWALLIIMCFLRLSGAHQPSGALTANEKKKMRGVARRPRRAGERCMLLRAARRAACRRVAWGRPEARAWNV